MMLSIFRVLVNTIYILLYYSVVATRKVPILFLAHVSMLSLCPAESYTLGHVMKLHFDIIMISLTRLLRMNRLYIYVLMLWVGISFCYWPEKMRPYLTKVLSSRCGLCLIYSTIWKNFFCKLGFREFDWVLVSFAGLCILKSYQMESVEFSKDAWNNGIAQNKRLILFNWDSEFVHNLCTG